MGDMACVPCIRENVPTATRLLRPDVAVAGGQTRCQVHLDAWIVAQNAMPPSTPSTTPMPAVIAGPYGSWQWSCPRCTTTGLAETEQRAEYEQRVHVSATHP